MKAVGLYSAIRYRHPRSRHLTQRQMEVSKWQEVSRKETDDSSNGSESVWKVVGAVGGGLPTSRATNASRLSFFTSFFKTGCR